jgi:hypothetical protein
MNFKSRVSEGSKTGLRTCIKVTYFKIKNFRNSLYLGDSRTFHLITWGPGVWMHIKFGNGCEKVEAV